MSGHSKWSTIKRQKGAADVKRGLAFTKLSNAITLAAKQGGGGDPTQNFKLRLAIETARTANMPKDNIERAIARAINRGAETLEEVVYEGFAPGGVSVIVEAATDNSLRTTSNVKSIFNKAGASFGQPGSVSYQFKNLGEIVVEKNDKSYDDIFLDAIDFGASDVEEEGSVVVVYTAPGELAIIKDKLFAKGYEVSDAQLILKPVTEVPLEGETREKLINFLDDLEALDDVQKVYTNLA